MNSSILSKATTTARVVSASPSMLRASNLRHFSVDCEPAQKLKSVLESYRAENFSREVRSRFQKQLLKPYVAPNGTIPIEDLNTLLVNIGHAEQALSPEEQTVLLEAAGFKQAIPVQKMMELISTSPE